MDDHRNTELMIRFDCDVKLSELPKNITRKVMGTYFDLHLDVAVYAHLHEEEVHCLPILAYVTGDDTPVYTGGCPGELAAEAGLEIKP